MDCLKLCVGERFDHDIPDAGMSIMLAGGTPLLTFNFSTTPGEINAFLNGTTSFALHSEENVLFFLFKIEGFLNWSDLAFTIHLAGEETIEEGYAYLPFNLVLVDPDSKIIQGLRMITVSPDFRSVSAGQIRFKQHGLCSMNGQDMYTHKVLKDPAGCMSQKDHEISCICFIKIFQNRSKLRIAGIM